MAEALTGDHLRQVIQGVFNQYEMSFYNGSKELLCEHLVEEITNQTGV
jgi:hypothetical protein